MTHVPWDPALAGFVADHLWQSTLFAAAAALVALMLRRNGAHVRYGVWFAASVKFLIPFAALVSVGHQFAWIAPSAVSDSPVATFIDVVGQPFSRAAAGVASTPSAVRSAGAAELVAMSAAAAWALGAIALLGMWAIRWHSVGRSISEAPIADDPRVLDIVRRLSGGRLTVKTSSSACEPGVFGMFRPVLLWPRSMGERLTDAHIAAIVTHELAHLRRRDNLAAAVHMTVQAIFWFHPAVWWIGVRLIDERERACDEEVVRQGSEPHVYAESLLKTCEFCIESPLVCVPGVTGSDLEKRIEAIMRADAGIALTTARRLLLVVIGIAAVATPVTVGALAPPARSGQTPVTDYGGARFELASIKPNRSGDGNGGMRAVPGGQYFANNVTLRQLVSTAFGAPLQPLLRDQIANAPGWIDSERFDIMAKADVPLTPGPGSPLPTMIRNLLAERFELGVHVENRPLPVYALVIARADGPQLKPAAVDCSVRRNPGNPPPPPPGPGDRPSCGIRFLRGSISAGGVTMAQLANALSRVAGRLVVDQTQLSGGFDLDLQWTPDQPVPPGATDPRFRQPPVDPNGPSLFTAIEEQLGFQLQPQNGPVDVLVIDHVARPAGDIFEMPVPPPPPPPAPAPPRTK